MTPSWKRLLVIATLGAWVGIFIIPFNPVNSKLLKLALLACLTGAWVGTVLLAWKRTALRVVTFAVPVVLAMPFLLPGRAIDGEALRADYVRRMGEFEGTTYFWGGESSRGIDCSGLPRRALRDALVADGFRTGNGRAFREFLEQWWYDTSAQALGEGYRGFTRPLGVAGTIARMDYGGLLPGDLAVTDSGVHVMAYAGEGKWIQADPGIGAVATLDGRTSTNGWFAAPVTVHRWRVLETR